MAWSVENRVPFLSLPLVETVLSLPEDYLVGDDALPKSLLRRAMKGIVPEGILERKDKVGFATSQSELLVLEDLGTENIVNRLRGLGLFEPKFLDQLEKGDLIVTETNYMLWRVVNLGIWLDILQAFKADHAELG